MEIHIFLNVLSELKEDCLIKMLITSTLALMAFHLLESRQLVLLLEKRAQFSKIIDMRVFKLYQVWGLYALHLIFSKIGIPIKKLKF